MSAIDDETLRRLGARITPTPEGVLALLVDMDARRAEAEKRAEEAETEAAELRARNRALNDAVLTFQRTATDPNPERAERLIAARQLAEMMNERAWIAGELGCQVDEIRNVLPIAVREAREMSHARDRAQKAEARLAAGCPKCGSDAISDESAEERSDADGRRVEQAYSVSCPTCGHPMGKAHEDCLCVCHRVNSIGTCTRCGYYGPGPMHDCEPKPAIEWYDDGRRELAGTLAGLPTHLAHGQITRMGSAAWSLVEMTWRLPADRAKEIAEKVYRFVEAELGRKP